MDTNKMRDPVREQFEAWHKRETAAFVAAGELEAARHMEAFKQTMLATWEASREAVVVELPSGSSLLGRMYGSEGGGIPLIERREAVEAIEAQGLKCGVKG